MPYSGLGQGPTCTQVSQEWDRVKVPKMELCLHLLLGSLNYPIRVDTGSPGATARIWKMTQEGERHDKTQDSLWCPTMFPCTRGRGRRMVWIWVGQRFVFLEFNPRVLFESARLSPGNRVGVWGRKGRFPVPSGTAGPGQTRNFLQNGAVTCRAAALLTALDMTLISNV